MLFRKILLLGGLGLSGFTAGLGFVVFYISEATSYLSDDPDACINCHVMIPEYASWRHSSHFHVTCNDCHIPHDNMLSKWWYKAKSGYRHSLVFTLRKEPQVIQAKTDSREVIQRNCLRCHYHVVSEAITPLSAGIKRHCIDCHREVPHGRTHSLAATPNAGVPPLSPVLPEWLRKVGVNEK